MTVLVFPGALVTESPAPPASCLIGRRPHPATERLLVCRHHLDELGDWLHDIQAEAERLIFDAEHPDEWAAAPRMESRYDTGRSTLASHRAPVVLDAIVYSDRRSRRVTPPQGPICDWCPTIAATTVCTCPRRPDRRARDTHWPGCAHTWAHPSCLHLLAALGEREAGADQLSSVLGVLRRWADQIRAERGLAHEPATSRIITPLRGPGGAVLGEWSRTIAVGPTVSSERLLLTRQLAWAASRPWIADMRDQVGDLRRRLLKINRNDDPKPLPGWCYRIVDGAECHGDLWPAEPVHTSGFESRAGVRAVVCGRNDNHRWEGDDLPRLLVIVDQQRREETA